MSEWLLPLFPLNVVLYPRVHLPLHIFEERYKEMISECIAAKGEFGVVLLQERSLANTGCAAYVTDVIKRYDDGRMDILTRGSRRFEVVSLNEEKSYLRGEPAFFEDEQTSNASDLDRQQAIELYERARNSLHINDNDFSLETGDEQLSYQIAARLPLDLEFKQLLLTLRSEKERLAKEIAYLRKLVMQLQIAAQVRKRAGSNGHGR